jgi:hypothetical protein
MGRRVFSGCIRSTVMINVISHHDAAKLFRQKVEVVDKTLMELLADSGQQLAVTSHSNLSLESLSGYLSVLPAQVGVKAIRERHNFLSQINLQRKMAK